MAVFTYRIERFGWGILTRCEIKTSYLWQQNKAIALWTKIALML